MSRRPPGREPVAVDILITSFNYGRFLAAAIDSALGQTHPQVRVVVVDDGSTDESREVIASYGERITAVLKENGGQASAFNAGFEHAHGPLVIFLDADDVLLPEAAARAVEALGTHPEAAKIQWRLELADADGHPTGAVLPPRHIPLPGGDMRRAELTFPFDVPWMATSGNAFPRATLERLLPMPEAGYREGADWYLQHLSALLGPVISIDEVGALRRVHGANAYELPADADVDLAHVRDAIETTARTRAHLENLADELGLPRRPGPILSVAYAANRLTSLRLEPAAHVVPADTRHSLAFTGCRAALRRFDVRLPMRLAYGCWFWAMALAPRPLARRLARWFAFPEQRRVVNRLLGRLHRGHGGRR